MNDLLELKDKNSSPSQPNPKSTQIETAVQRNHRFTREICLAIFLTAFVVMIVSLAFSVFVSRQLWSGVALGSIVITVTNAFGWRLAKRGKIYLAGYISIGALTVIITILYWAAPYFAFYLIMLFIITISQILLGRKETLGVGGFLFVSTLLYSIINHNNFYAPDGQLTVVDYGTFVVWWVLIAGIAWLVGFLYDITLHDNKILNLQAEKLLENQKQLVESETRYRGLSEASLEGIILHDQGHILEVNQTLTEMLGYEAAELIGKFLLELIVFPSFLSIHSPSQLDYAQTVTEAVAIRKDGSQFSIETQSRKFLYRGREVSVNTVRDITLRKQTEDKLQKQTQRLQALAQLSQLLAEVSHDYTRVLDIIVKHIVEAIGDGCAIALISEDRSQLEVVAIYHSNPQIVETYLHLVERAPLKLKEGIAGQVIQTRQPVLQPKLSLEEVVADVKPEFQEEAQKFPIYSRITVPLKAQEEIIGVLALSRYEPGHPYTLEDQLFLQSLADRAALAITNAHLYSALKQELAERKRVEAVLVRSRKRLRRITDNMLDVIYQTDVEGKCQYVSPSCQTLLGYQVEEVLGHSLWEFVHPEDRAKFSTAVETAGQMVGPAKIEFRYRHKAGHYLWLELVGKPLLTKKDQREGAIFTARDITERKAVEAAVQHKEAQLRQAQKMEAIGLLAGGVAHDFNNLLTVILGYSNLVLMRLGDSQAQPMNTELVENIQQIEAASQRAASLTRQLLAFSRQQVLKPQPLNLNQIIVEIGKLLRRVIGENIDFDILLKPELEQVMMDPGQLEQVLMNLAVNARDAMPNGGVLTIETDNVYLEDNYSIGQPNATIKAGNYVMLAVSDNGIGMDDSTQNRIFEPFFTTKEKGHGTGLGLATVYGIIEQSGGYIKVYSSLGVGTTFKIYLPPSSKDVIGEQVEVENPNSQALLHGTETILVVEDEEPLRNLIQRTLAIYGYKTITAANGLEALKVVESNFEGIDLILTDLIMPEMGGFELLIEMRKRLTKVKLVCMSGYTDRVAVQQGIMELCDNYIQKPFSLNTLLQQLKQSLKTP